MENFDGMLQTNDTSLIQGEWITLSGGGKFQYTGNATNNPYKSATFTVSGDSIMSTDNLTVTNNGYSAVLGGNRMAVAGLSGNASIDGVELGISGDSNYSAHFTKINDQSPINIVLMDVSDGATVAGNYMAGVDNDGLIQFSDGKHSVLTSDNPQGKVTSIEASNGGNGTIAIADETLSAGGENNFTVEFDNEEK